MRDRVLRLAYTAHDLAGFARELGYDGPPFSWDEEERRQLMAQLDALMFRLYALEEGDIDYVLSTFPIIRRDDEERYGRFRTRDLILAYRRAQEANDFSSRIAL